VIRKEELLQIAKLKGLAPRLAELDYLQDIVLLNIYREFGNKLIFKGGTCLYKLYQLNRFSEDIDFTAKRDFRPKEFFDRLPYFFGLLDINAKVKVEQFEKIINVYLKIFGPLYDGRKERVATLILNISLRERILLPIHLHSYIPVYKDIRPFDLFAMDEQEILAEKVRAIYERAKARDVYDVWYLLIRKNIPFDIKLVNKKLSHVKVKFDKSKFLTKIEEKHSSWERDLAFLVAGQLSPFEQVKREIEERIK
jgi:hypothetical protein